MTQDATIDTQETIGTVTLTRGEVNLLAAALLTAHAICFDNPAKAIEQMDTMLEGFTIGEIDRQDVISISNKLQGLLRKQAAR